MASLHSIQEVLNDPSIKCKQAEDVRWLSHDMAIKAVICTLSSILVSLNCEASENSDPTAHGLLNFMKSYKFVACTYLLSDILPHLSRLSCIFQKQHIDLSLVQPCLKTTIDSIKQYETTPGPNLRKLDEVLSSDLKDFDITPTDVQKTEFRSSIQVKYIQAVIVELNNHFPNVNRLDAFSVFDPQKVPTNPEDLAVYGQQQIECLQVAYGEGASAGVDSAECVSDWEGLKRLLSTSFHT